MKETMKTSTARVNGQRNSGEQGFVLVAALMVMLVLTIIGIIATTNTSTELQIAGNDKVYKETFYNAEAGAALGTELLEQNLACATGFSGTGKVVIENAVLVQEQANNKLTFWANDALDPELAPGDAGYNSERVVGRDADADAVFPMASVSAEVPESRVGRLYIGGRTEPLMGGALEMAAGYEGRGKSAAQGGVAKIYDIYSQYNGVSQSESIVLQGWRHVVGMEGSCLY